MAIVYMGVIQLICTIIGLNAQLEAEKFAADTSRLRIIELENVIRQYQNNYALQESLSRKTEEEFQAELQVTI